MRRLGFDSKGTSVGEKQSCSLLAPRIRDANGQRGATGTCVHERRRMGQRGSPTAANFGQQWWRSPKVLGSELRSIQPMCMGIWLNSGKGRQRGFSRDALQCWLWPRGTGEGWSSSSIQ